ncbi:hypothetical protein Tco_1381998 [Tanacetum coccineum]
MFKLDLEPLAPRLLQNREIHIEYLKYTQEQADILWGIVEQAKAKQPLDKELDFACKHAQRIQELLIYVRDTCPNAIKLNEKKVAITPKNKVKKVTFAEPVTSSSNIKQVVQNCSLVSGLRMFKTYDKEPLSAHELYDLGKLDAKADIGIFIGYAPAKKAFRIYNKRTQKIIETIHVTFDELTTMASEQFSSGPRLQLFDEYFNPSPIAVTLVQKVAAPRPVVLADYPVSTFIEQDAPSSSTPSTQEQEQSPNISQGFEESTSQGSSSNMRQTHTLFEHLGRWTKDHPIANVIGNPSCSVSMRKQL